MAVQQNKKSPSRRGMRRGHDALGAAAAMGIDPQSGEAHRRHHITADGYYRGRRVFEKREEKDAANEEAGGGEA